MEFGKSTLTPRALVGLTVATAIFTMSSMVELPLSNNLQIHTSTAAATSLALLWSSRACG